jgi:hypothetical protein
LPSINTESCDLPNSSRPFKATTADSECIPSF